MQGRGVAPACCGCVRRAGSVTARAIWSDAMTTVEVPVPANAVGSPINWREIASRAVVQAKFKAGRSAFAEDFAGRAA
jgi:hypothetical protein